MKNRLSNLLLALVFCLSGGPLLAQNKAEPGPSILEPEPEVQEESSVPLEEAATDESLRTIPIQETGTVLSIPEAVVEPPRRIALPQHGMKMDDVERHYGAPVSREPAVGNPPITRWNYDGFSVFFEYSTVLHAVQKGRPAEIYRKDELLPASSP